MAIRAAALVSLPFFILGRVLIGRANIAAISCLGLAVALVALGFLAETHIKRAKTETGSLGRLARFFSACSRRRPIRFFGPIGAGLLGILAPLAAILPNFLAMDPLPLTAPLIAAGLFVLCFGLFGEIIVFANAERVQDYRVETFLNVNTQGNRS